MMNIVNSTKTIQNILNKRTVKGSFSVCSPEAQTVEHSARNIGGKVRKCCLFNAVKA